INDSMVKYKDFDNEVIKISPRDSITFTLSDETISDTRFHFFDTYLNYILSKDSLEFHLKTVSIDVLSEPIVINLKENIERNYFIDNKLVRKTDTIKFCDTKLLPENMW